MAPPGYAQAAVYPDRDFSEAAGASRTNVLTPRRADFSLHALVDIRKSKTSTRETYEGDHTNRVKERFELKVLPFFSNNLSFTPVKGEKRGK